MAKYKGTFRGVPIVYEPMPPEGEELKGLEVWPLRMGGLMRSGEKIRRMMEKIEADDRMIDDIAMVDENALLALIQTSGHSFYNALRWVLGEEGTDIHWTTQREHDQAKPDAEAGLITESGVAVTPIHKKQRLYYSTPQEGENPFMKAFEESKPRPRPEDGPGEELSGQVDP